MESDVALARMSHANTPSANICVCVLEGARPCKQAALSSAVTQEKMLTSTVSGAHFFLFFILLVGVRLWKIWTDELPRHEYNKTDACALSPKPWANQTGANAEEMKPVIKTSVSHRQRCGEASTRHDSSTVTERFGSLTSCVSETSSFTSSFIFPSFLTSKCLSPCFPVYLCLEFFSL